MEKLLSKKLEISTEFVEDINKIVSILTHYGASKVILYGSVARGDYNTNSDIDICFEGMPDKNYFPAVARCLMESQRRVSILDFTSIKGYLKQRILKEGKILYEFK